METVPENAEAVRAGLAEHDYLADEGLATSIFLALALRRPLLLEGEAGVGKTEVAKVLAEWTGGELVRLQCYEGIDATQAVYEWDYARQLLHLRALEASGAAIDEDELYSAAIPREAPAPACASRTRARRPPVLLIDEVDRADDEFEAFLLELLSDWTISVPELGTVHADVPPVVVLTSNRTRDVHDASEAPLPLPLDPASRLRARARDHPAACARGARVARARRRGGGRGVARPRALQAAGRGGDHRLGAVAGDARRGAARRAVGRRDARARS